MEVEGKSWLKSEAVEQWNREAAKVLAALCCLAAPVLKMKRPTSACQCEEAPCFMLGRKNTRNADCRTAILDFELKFNLIVIPQRKGRQNEMNFPYLLVQA